MDLKTPIPILELAKKIGATVIGNDALLVSSLNEIHKVKFGSLTFVDSDKYLDRALYSAASAVLVHRAVDCPEGKALLLSEEPFDAYNTLALYYNPFAPLVTTVSPCAEIGEGTHLEPNVTLGKRVQIGRNCLIRANVTILDDTQIGDNVIIHPGTVIGSDAFYFKKKGEAYTRWHSIGRVIVHDDVEIGAGCTIDRGVSGDTVIGQGTKMDNLVHVAHGVVIGKNCLIAAQVGIAGKTIIQDNVILYGQVGVSKSLVVGEGAVIMAQSGVSKSLQGGRTYFGSPAGETRQRFKELAALRRLPDFFHEWDQKNGKKTNEPDAHEMLGPEFGETP
jgi:UDP-3-O-[3-hydroxymyristoyl] glucosamine N-acyltransferase